MAALSERPAESTIEYARKAFNMRATTGLKAVAHEACLRLGLRRPSDFAGSMSRLLLTAAGQKRPL